MASRREARLARRTPHRYGAARRWAIPIIGAITPILLIVVNIAAFIVHHLSGFRLIITISAFVSGLLLGSWQALNAYRVVRERVPDGAIFHKTNEDLVLVSGMTMVILVSFLVAFACYQGLADEKQLPNLLTFVGGAGGIAMPILQSLFFRRVLGRRDVDSGDVGT